MALRNYSSLIKHVVGSGKNIQLEPFSVSIQIVLLSIIHNSVSPMHHWDVAHGAVIILRTIPLIVEPLDLDVSIVGQWNTFYVCGHFQELS